eukprot:7655693-Lingulodinium_polyedra.AAC.1
MRRARVFNTGVGTINAHPQQLTQFRSHVGSRPLGCSPAYGSVMGRWWRSAPKRCRSYSAPSVLRPQFST